MTDHSRKVGTQSAVQRVEAIDEEATQANFEFNEDNFDRAIELARAIAAESEARAKRIEELESELEKWKHLDFLKECAATPLMWDVMARAEEAERLLAAARPTEEEAELAVETLESIMVGTGKSWIECATILAHAILRIHEATKEKK